MKKTIKSFINRLRNIPIGGTANKHTAPTYISMKVSDLATTEWPTFRLINPANSSLRHLGRSKWLYDERFKKAGRIKKLWQGMFCLHEQVRYTVGAQINSLLIVWTAAAVENNGNVRLILD